MARTATLGTPLQQIDEMQSVGERQDAAKRTQKAAIGTLGEQANHKQRARVKDIRPRAGEMRRDGGVERFHLRDARPHIGGERGEAEDERRQKTYFPSPQDTFAPDSGGFHCGRPMKRESCASNSCKAPKGQSQPQNTPRPSSTSEIAVYMTIITISGSAR